MKYLKNVVLLLLALSVSVSGYGQTEITGMPFLQLGSGAESLAMGEALVAFASYPGSSHYNPAGIGKEEIIQISSFVDFQDGLSSSRGYRNADPGFADFNASVKDDNWAYSASVKYHRSAAGAPRIGRVENPYEPNEYVVNFSSAYTFNFGLSLGMGLNYINSNLEGSFSPLEGNERINTFSVDFGAHYNRTVKLSEEVNFKPSIGLSITDFGPTIDYKSDTWNDALPMTFRTGVGTTFETARTWHQRPFVSVTLAASISKIMARRHDGGSPYGPFRALFGSWDSYEYTNICFGSVVGGCSTSSVSLKDQFNTQQGIELSFFETAHFRLGRNHQAYINGDNSYTALGFGLELYYFQLDYTYLNYDAEFDGGSFSLFQLNGRIPITNNTASFLTFGQ